MHIEIHQAIVSEMNNRHETELAALRKEVEELRADRDTYKQGMARIIIERDLLAEKLEDKNRSIKSMNGWGMP